MLIERGHYAIAGFLYQLLGSGVAAFEILKGLKDGQTPTELLVVERFGQDAVALPVGDDGKKPRLIQYKFAMLNKPLAPSDLRIVL